MLWLAYGISAFALYALLSHATWIELGDYGFVLAIFPLLYVGGQMFFHWLTH
jgi:hypothetical protein